MANTEKLKQLFDKLKNTTFMGIGLSKWYPEGNQMAYYRMEYSPGKFKLRHKSPSSLQECLFDVQYCSIDDFNCVSINIYLDQRLHRSYTTKDEIDKFGLSDDAAGFFIKYLLKDPRYVLAAAEVIIEIPTDIPNTKIYGIKAFDTTSFDPLFGIKILVLFILEGDALKMMGMKKFIGEKE